MEFVMQLFSILLVLMSSLLSGIVETCPTPNSSHPLSLCAYCSDEHAGVRWIAHTENGFDTLQLLFNCTNKEGNFIIHNNIEPDPCFGKKTFRYSVETLSETVRVHIISAVLPPETECVFRAYKDKDHEPVVANCSVKTRSECDKYPEDCHLPANCSVNRDNNQCSCTCTDGYAPLTDNSPGSDGTVCNNVDECSKEPNPCHDINNATCMDTEGSFLCICNDGTRMVQDGNYTGCSPVRDDISMSLPTTLITASEDSSSLTDSLVLSSATLYTTLPSLISKSAITTSYLQRTPTTSDFTENEFKSTQLRLIFGILIPVVVLVLSGTTFAILIGVPLRTRKQQRKLIKLVKPQLPFITDEFDPDFYPAVKIEESHKFKMSDYSILHTLEQERIIECSLIIDKPVSKKLHFKSIVERSSEHDCSSNESTTTGSNPSLYEDEVANCIQETSSVTPMVHMCAASIQPENKTQPFNLDVHTQEYSVTRSCNTGYVIIPDNMPSVDCFALSTHAPTTEQRYGLKLQQNSDTPCTGTKTALNSNNIGYVTRPSDHSDPSAHNSGMDIPVVEVLSLCENVHKTSESNEPQREYYDLELTSTSDSGCCSTPADCAPQPKEYIAMEYSDHEVLSNTTSCDDTNHKQNLMNMKDVTSQDSDVGPTVYFDFPKTS